MHLGRCQGFAVEPGHSAWPGMVRKVIAPFWKFFLLEVVQVSQGKTMNNKKILFHLASNQLCIMTSGLFNVTYPW